MQPTSDPVPVAPDAVLRTRTFKSMGTLVSLTVAGSPGTPAETSEDELGYATAVVEQLFARLDARFSLYRPESEASLLARGELQLAGASQEMRERYAEAVEWRRLSRGAFTPERPDGVLDLSGIIKAHAIREAEISLGAVGLRNWCLNAGGDVLIAGSPDPGSLRPWLAGVVDPADRGKLLAAYPLPGGSAPGAGYSGSAPGPGYGSGPMRALATSGSAERGDHIWGAGGTMRLFRQVSVAAPDIVTADVLATAIVAGGPAMLDRAVDQWNVDVLAVRQDGSLLATSGFRKEGRVRLAG